LANLATFKVAAIEVLAHQAVISRDFQRLPAECDVPHRYDPPLRHQPAPLLAPGKKEDIDGSFYTNLRSKM
jgi:hypothetical protein